MKLELVPPGCHRRNAAEAAIQNFKAHFLSILAGVSDDFPMQLWDCLLPQADITVNLLRQSNATATVSAYAYMSGPFDYNKMPLALMGCNVQVHEKTDKRGTWAFHSVDGWYLATSPEHYRTHKCHIKSTRSDRYSNTVSFQHKDHDKVMKAIADCSNTIKGLGNHDATAEMNDLQQIVANTSPTIDEHRNPVSSPVVPRVDNDLGDTDNDSVQITRSMTNNPPTQGMTEPRVANHKTPTAASPRVVTTPASRTRRIKSRRRRSVPP